MAGVVTIARMSFWALRSAYLACVLRRIESIDLAHPEASAVRGEYLHAVDRLRAAAGAHA
jgi:hypothetical protein